MKWNSECNAIDNSEFISMPDVTMCTLPSTQSECLVVLVVTSVAMNLFLPLCCYERLLLCSVVS